VIKVLGFEVIATLPIQHQFLPTWLVFLCAFCQVLLCWIVFFCVFRCVLFYSSFHMLVSVVVEVIFLWSLLFVNIYCSMCSMGFISFFCCKLRCVRSSPFLNPITSSLANIHNHHVFTTRKLGIFLLEKLVKKCPIWTSIKKPTQSAALPTLGLLVLYLLEQQLVVGFYSSLEDAEVDVCSWFVGGVHGGYQWSSMGSWGHCCNKLLESWHNNCSTNLWTKLLHKPINNAQRNATSHVTQLDHVKSWHYV
jgi:hypothetical protein